MSADGVVELIPYGADPLQVLADRLFHRHADRLPDLSSCLVLFPQAVAIPRFHRVLLQTAERSGHQSLLPPECGTLEGWATRRTRLTRPVLHDTARESLFFEALQQHPELRRQFGTWPLIDSLLRLFDEITMERCHLPDNAERFLDVVAAGYGSGSRDLTPLSDEAALVHSLWRAWHEQLEARNRFDRPAHYLAALAECQDSLPETRPVYTLGFVALTRAETEWLRECSRRRGVTIFLQGRPTNAGSTHPDLPVTECLREFGSAAEAPSAPYSQFLDRAFAAHDAPLRDRAREQARVEPDSPATGRLRLFASADAESEARAIALQLRRWKLAGKTQLAIVTADRRLARRVRALLERAGIAMLDAAGWALSTTSAATVVARWIECVEEDFHHAALLDLLRSPFLVAGGERPENHAATVDSLERDVVLARNIRRGLAALRAAGNENVRDLLDRIDEAARPLAGTATGHERPGIEFVRALRASLQRLGVVPALARDDAGREVLATLDELESAFAGTRAQMRWDEFVRWLERTLERRRFQPPLHGTGVELLGFAESRLHHFDALIIAGADARHLPGAPDVAPLFNDGVRGHLGLPRAERRYNALFYDFRRLLEAAPEVLVTFRREERGEPLAPSPWVECLGTFHELAYRDGLDDPVLRALTYHPETVIVMQTAPRPVQLRSVAAAFPPTRLPEALHASGWQSLIDCPYQFLCRYGLALPPAPDTREEMEGSDFGQRVHRILEAFHTGVAGLPGPFRESLNADSRATAHELMHAITTEAFAADLRQSRLTQTWIYRWLGIADQYLDWQWRRAETWRVLRTEAALRRALDHRGDLPDIAGRIDRIDVDATGRLGLIDYKTGAVPKFREVTDGEAVQLPLYALLPEQRVAEVTYLELGHDGLQDRLRLSGEELDTLVSATGKRLQQLGAALARGACLPAHGDNTTCARCAYMGLCRRQHWETGHVVPAMAP